MKADICPYTRREALEIHDLDDKSLATVCENLDDISDDRAKALYYGAVGQLVESVVDNTINQPLPQRSINNFAAFDIAIADQLTVGIGQTMAAPTSRLRVDTGQRLLRRLGETRHIPHDSLYDALEGGCHTAGMAIGYHMQHFNKYLEQNDQTERVAKLARSVGTLISHASLHGEQQGIADTIRYEGPDPVVEPSANGKALSYAVAHHDIELTARAHAKLILATGGIGQADAKTVGDIKGGSATIGCPILFKPKQLQDLWSWSIDEAVRYGLVDNAA